jgi:hypothetical protein
MRFAFVAEAIVHFQPRSTLQQFARQYFLYARGDAVAGLWPRRHALRYAVYLWVLVCLLLGGWWVAPIVLGMGAYCARPWQRLWRRFHEGVNGWQIVLAMILVPFLRVVGDGAKMVGYVAGWIRLAQHPHIRRDRDAWLAEYLPHQ